MKILMRTTNPTVISFVKHLLGEAGIMAFVMDENISILEGSIGIFPRRIMVGDDDLDDALKIIKKNDLEHELDPKKP